MSKTRDICRSRGTRAFTLIELLAVIAVIAILAALFLAVLGEAKAKARRVQCVSNLKQWNLALAGYVADNDDFIPREGYLRDGKVRVDNWAQVYSADSKDVWYNALPTHLNVRPARAYFSIVNGERPRFYESRIFHCPSAKFPAGVGGYEEAFFSLAMNSKLIQPPVLANGSIRFEWIQRKSDTATFLDARVSQGERKVDALQLDTDLGQPSIFASRFAARHGQGGNIAFADGHVSWNAGRSVVETRPLRARRFAIFPDGYILWCSDPLADPNVGSE